MRLRLGLFALVSLVVVIVATALSSFVVHPENIGVRLALYALALVAAIATIVCGIFAVKPAEVADAVAAGRQAYARVVSAVPTGAQLNGAYAYDARLVVAATDVPPYQVTDRVRVHRTDGKLTGQGEILTVVRLVADSPQVVVTAGPASTPQDVAVPQEAPAWPGE
jgi:hypothetical protein